MQIQGVSDFYSAKYIYLLLGRDITEMVKNKAKENKQVYYKKERRRFSP